MTKTVAIITMKTTHGGIERFVATLANSLADDYKIKIIATYGEAGKESFAYRDNIEIKYLVKKAPEIISAKELLSKRDIIGLLKEIPRRISINYEKRVCNKRAIEELDTDIVITERAYYSKLVGKYLRNKKTVKIASDHNYHQNNKKYIRKLVASVKGFDYLILSTKELYDFYKKIIKKPKCVLIPNGIPSIPKKKSKLSTQNIVAVGRLEPEKGFLELIDVMKRLHENNSKIKLFLIGDGSQSGQIKEKINNYGLEKYVIMPGMISQKKIADYFYESSIYVMTSMTEAFGLVLIEAMSFGLPCIAFDDASGARGLITPDVGVLVKNRSHEQMAAKILELLNDRKKLLYLQKNINDYVRAFDASTIKAEWINILK